MKITNKKKLAIPVNSTDVDCWRVSIFDALEFRESEHLFSGEKKEDAILWALRKEYKEEWVEDLVGLHWFKMLLKLADLFLNVDVVKIS